MSTHQLGRQHVVVRSVWAWNLEYEFSIIASLVPSFLYVAFDTEFPGLVYRYPHHKPPHDHLLLLSPDHRYALLKANVDALHLIQLGLTLFDAAGNLPDLGTRGRVGFVWEFNFRDFDLRRDLHAPDSIELLRSGGLDFDRLRLFGVDSGHFAACLYRSGLASCCPLSGRFSAGYWIAFQGSYDLGYLVKVLGSGRPLPDTMDEFLVLVGLLFGRVVDVKYVTRFCDELRGGLESVARRLEVARAVGSSHQAGSDSLLTCRVFLKMKEKFFDGKEDEVGRHQGIICGLQAC